MHKANSRNVGIKFTTLTSQASFQPLNSAAGTFVFTCFKKYTFSIVLTGLFNEKYLGPQSLAVSLQMFLLSIFLSLPSSV